MLHPRPPSDSARCWPRLFLSLLPAFFLLAVPFSARAADPPPAPDEVDAFRAAFRKDLDTIVFRSLDLPLLRDKLKRLESDPDTRNPDDIAKARENVDKAEKELAAAFEERNTGLTKVIKDDLATAGRYERVALANLIGEEALRIRYPTAKVVPDFAAKLHPEVPALIEMTEAGPKNPLDVRVAATLALGKTNGDPKAVVPALAKLLRDQDNPVPLRMAAAEALGRPVNHLLQSTQNINAAAGGKPGAEKDDATKELRLILLDGGALTWPAVLDGLKDKSPVVRLASAHSARDVSAAFLEQAQVAGSRDFFKDYAPLMKAFRDEMPKLLPVLETTGDPPLRQLVLTIVQDLAIARLRLASNLSLDVPPKPVSGAAPLPRPDRLPDDPPLLPVSVQAAPAKDPSDLAAALSAAVPSLIKALHSPTPDTRLAAAHVLESIGDEAAGVIPDLARGLSDPDRFVRWTLLRTLGRLAPREAKMVVTAAAPLCVDEDIDVRLAALKTVELYAKEAAYARPFIARTIANDDTVVQLAGLKALQAIGDGEGPTLQVVADLMLNNADVSVRVSAAETLGRAGKSAASYLPAIERALSDDDDKVRAAASEALLRIKK